MSFSNWAPSITVSYPGDIVVADAFLKEPAWKLFGSSHGASPKRNSQQGTYASSMQRASVFVYA
jgi:hypothetical protein